jgi:hypothetical protein
LAVDKGQQWELFGYDVRRLGKHWLAAWRGFLSSQDSPLRRRLDDVVCLHHESGSTLYQAGKPVGPAPYDCEGLLLPDELVLSRSLSFPLAVEGDLDAALALELSANSPFSADDTAFGWQIVDRDANRLHVILVIVSKSAVMSWMGGKYGLHDPAAREIWADVNGSMVVVRGFGEELRESRYRRRLLRSTAIVALGAGLVLLMAAVGAGTKRAELSQLEARAASTQRAAAQPSNMRARVALASETVDTLQALVAAHPNPHYEIARLTRLLGDGVHVLQFSMTGREVRLRGRAEDAAAVMQILTGEPDYAEVTAPQAIIKVANTGLEQFSLNLTLAGSEAP